MIAHIVGVIAEKFGSSVIVDVGGVGYEVQLALTDYNTATIDSTVKYHTYHHIREQSQELFGFSSLVAKKLFELLITVQGVGPKVALAILSLGETENVRNAIASEDVLYINKASGVGKKTAERVIVDLSDKVGHVVNSGGVHNMAILNNIKTDEALEALMALGYNLNDATMALEGVSRDISTAERVTLALRSKS